MRQRPDASGRPSRSEPAASVASQRSRLAALAVLIGLCCVVYVPGLRGGFVSDDAVLLPHLRQVVAARGLGAVFGEDMLALETGTRTGFYRPLAGLSLLADQAIFGNRPFGFHVTNLLLHILATCLVLFLASQARLSAPAALGAAALFAVHPVHVEAVAWISGRFDLLCGALYLLALWLFGRAHAQRSSAFYAGSLLAGAAALLSKEMALTLPAAVLLYDGLGMSRGAMPRRVVPRGLWREGWRGIVLRAAPFGILVSSYLVLRNTSRGLGLDSSSVAERLPGLELVCTAGRAVLFYLGRLVAPVHLNAFPVVPPVLMPWSPWFLAGALALLALLVVGLRLRRRQPVVAFGILFVIATLVPLSNAVGFYPLVKSRFPVAERYLYLPSFGFVLALAAFGWDWARRAADRQRRAFSSACALLVVAGAGRSLARIPDWRSDGALFTATVRQNPTSAWAHVMLGAVQRQAGQFDEARASFETALRFDPRFYTATFEMATLESQQGRNDEAARWYQRAIDLQPRARDARLGLAMALRRAGKLPEAAREFAAMSQLGAHDSEFLVNRGELYLVTGQIDAAVRDFEAALVVNPARKEALYNLGVVALQRGQLEEAATAARGALAIDPRYLDPHMLLGSIAVRRQDFASAAQEYEQAVALDSTHVLARVNLGATYLNVGKYEQAIRELRVALRRGPTPQAWVNLAEAQSRSQAPLQAEESFRAALALDPRFVPASRGLGLLLAADPTRAEEARGLLEPLAAVSPTDAELTATLARLGKRAPSPASRR
jgi:tetratricopeptide (TPR) repeat protein